MGRFLSNLIILTGIILVLFAVSPTVMKGIVQLYDSFGILPIVIIMLIIFALPSKSRRRRR